MHLLRGATARAERPAARRSCASSSAPASVPTNISCCRSTCCNRQRSSRPPKRCSTTSADVDILVHCAGISQRAHAVDTQLSVDRQIMELNYFGPVGLTKQVLPSMIGRGAGQIVVISSLLGKIAAPTRSAYCASKHALHGFFDSLRAEVHRTWNCGDD